MTRYRLSSHLVKDPANAEVWLQTYTNERLRPGLALKALIDEIVTHGDEAGLSGPAVLRRLVIEELLERGFIIPAHVPDEERHLDQSRPFKPGDPIFDMPRTLFDDLPGNGDAVIFGVACDLGADFAGASNGPALIRRASRKFGWRGRASKDGFTIGAAPAFEGLGAHDLGDVRLSQRDLDGWLSVVESVSKRVAAANVPVMLGGDHVLTFAAVKGLLKARQGKPFTLVQFDQHLDIQFRGRFLEDGPEALHKIAHHNFISHIKALAPEMRFVQIGIDHYQCAGAGVRDPTVAYLKALGQQVSDLEVRMNDASSLTEVIGEGQDVYVTLDVDIFPRSFVSSTGYPAALGVPFDRVLPLIKHTLTRNHLIGMDIMEFGVTEPNRTSQTDAEALCVATLLAQMLEYRVGRSSVRYLE